MKKTLLIFFFSGVCCLAQILPDTFDPDARLYFTNVQVNGGMIGIGAKIAVSQFINQCKIDGNWTNLSEVGLFAGVGNFSAALWGLARRLFIRVMAATGRINI